MQKIYSLEKLIKKFIFNVTIILKLPKLFCLFDTLNVIQRGSIDPINIVNGVVITRLINLDGRNLLVRVYQEKEFLKIKIINDNLYTDQFKTLSLLITKWFGLDDPLFFKKINIDSKICPSLIYSTGVHGYLSLFEATVQTIIGQFISANVANSLRRNFILKFGEFIHYKGEKYYFFPLPRFIQNLSVDEIMATGVSKLKSKAIIQIANEFIQNNLEYRLVAMNNKEEIKDTLTTFCGIGRWTSDWISLRGLRNFDVVPSGDLIVRKAFSWWLGLREIIPSSQIDLICQKWSPYAGSVAYRIMYSYIKIQQKLIN